MHLNNRPPIFVPAEYRKEIEQLSKAALMDIAWDYAAQLCGKPDDLESAMAEFRKRREIILSHRRQAKHE